MRRDSDPQRAVLLSRIESLWIQGVLEASLRDAAPIDVPMAATPDEVAHPWADVVRVTQTTPRRIGELDEYFVTHDDSLLLLGPPGGGKTTTLLLLARALLEQARVDPSSPVPVVLNLSSFGSFSGPLRNWIEDELVHKYSLPRPRIARWLANDGLVLLLDGLDEIASERRERCVKAINEFRVDHPLRTVVTCRTDDYAALGPKLGFETALRLEAVPDDVIAEHLPAASAGRRLVEGDGDDAPPALRTPLMLSLLSERQPDTPSANTDPLGAAYDAYIARALERRGLSGATAQRRLRALEWLARAKARMDLSEIWIESLSPAWFETTWQRVMAWSLGLVMLVAICVGVVAAGATFSGQVASSGEILGLGAAAVVLIFNRGLRISPVEELQWSWRRALTNLPRSVGLGLLVGAIYGLFFILWINVINGAVLGVVLMMVTGLEPSEKESRVIPNSAIRRSALTASLLGIIGGIVGGLMLGFVVAPLVHPELDPRSSTYGLEHPHWAVFFETASLMAVVVGMIYGGTAVVFHAATRITMWLTTPVPLRLVRTLDRAVDLGLMRRIGGGYLFLHRTLRDHLAVRPDAKTG